MRFLGTQVGLYGGLLTLLLVAAPARADTAPAWQGLADPRVRAAQFDALTGKSYEALTQLLADRRQGLLKQRPEQADWVLAGLYLTQGASRKAAELFKQMAMDDQSLPIRNQAWFALAQVQNRHGLGDEALESLARIEGALPDAQQQERLLMAAVLLMERGRFDEAETRLRQLREPSLRQSLGSRALWPSYGRFNLGVALHKQGHTAEARALLVQVGELDTRDAEISALKDKANVTLGYDALAREKPAEAEPYFRKARLSGPLAGKALLGLGRAYSQQQRYKQSLVPWLNLARRDASEVAVQDGLLAAPFAFGKLEAYKQALDYYDSALAAFKLELERLSKAETEVKNGSLLDGLLAQATASRGAPTLPNTAASRHLWSLFSTDAFQVALENYARLHLARERLGRWSATLAQERGMAPSQRQGLQQRVADLQQRVAATADEIRQQLQTEALQELQRRKQRIISYAGEVRFSIAQIYDYAAKRWGTKQ